MVSSINSDIQNINYNPSQYNNIKQAAKNVGVQAAEQIPDSFTSTAKSAGQTGVLFAGIPHLFFMKNNKKINEIVTSTGKKIIKKDAFKAIDKNTLNAFKQIFTDKSIPFTKRIGRYIKTVNQSKEDFNNLKDAVKAVRKAGKALQSGSKYGAEEANNLIKDAFQKADTFVNPKESAIKLAQSKLDDITKKLASNPSSKILKLQQAKITKKLNNLKLLQNGTKAAGKFGTLKNCLKSSGAGIMLAFSGISEFISEVYPTFKELGFKKGMKQLAKSSVKVIGDTAGYIAGEQAGMAIGSAIGSALFPGVGTVIGAVCGLAGGILGSWAVGKIIKPISGKTEREIYHQQQENQQADNVENNNPFMDDNNVYLANA